MGMRAWSKMESEKKVSLRRITSDEGARWDALVDASPTGTVFHSWAWVSTIAKHSWQTIFGKTITPRFHPLIAEYEGKDIGLIPLYEFKGPYTTYVFSPPPHSALTYLGPCLNFPENIKQTSWERLHKGFQNSVEEYMKGLKANCIRIRTPPGFKDPRPYLWQGYEVTPLYNYVTDLHRPVERIFNESEPNFRNKIRRTEREGYTIREGGFEDVKRLYEQVKARYAEQSLPMNINFEYLKDLWENLKPGRLKATVIEKDGKYVCASLEAHYRGRVLGWIGNPKVQSSSGSPNDLLMWEIVKRASTGGNSEYENIWANEERLNPFKTKMNPRVEHYYSIVRMSPLMSLAYTLRHNLLRRESWGEEI
jgi:hypothetical protein